MDFTSAFQAIKDATLTNVENDNPKGMRMRLWTPDVTIRIQRPSPAFSKMTHPYLYVESNKGMVPWIPTYVEMFSDEWELVQ